MIDDNLLPWPQAVDRALTSFRCGTVIESPPLAYHAVGRYALWSASTQVEGLDELELVDLADPDRPPFGIITTETCDLIEEDRDHKLRPWFQVSPVIDLAHLDDQVKSSIENLRSTYLCRLTGPRFADGFYVADLRISIPLEKSALVGRVAIIGFASAEEERAFAIQVGEMSTRPVWPNSVQQIIVGELKQYFRKKSRRTALRALMPLELRLAVTGSDSAPIVALLVYLDRTEEADARLLFEPYWKSLEVSAVAAGLTLMPIRYGDDMSFSSGDLRSSSTLRLPS